MRALVPTWRAWRVWQRNATTYRQVWLGNLLGHLADPLFYLAVLGYGLGSLMPPVDGVPYVTFLVTGVVAGAAMASACFETSYSSFLRMSSQGTFDAIVATPVSKYGLAVTSVAAMPSTERARSRPQATSWLTRADSDEGSWPRCSAKSATTTTSFGTDCSSLTARRTRS